MRARSKGRAEGFGGVEYALFAVATAVTFVVCVAVGSINISFADAVAALWHQIGGSGNPAAADNDIIVIIRLPRVLAAALTGAALAVSGCAMQGLLRNPLADGSTLGVSAGASLGAGLAITLGLSVPWLPLAGTTTLAIGFAFVSLLIILGLAYRLDHSLSTNTIILIGVIFSMFASALMAILITFSGDRLRSIIFWTMGSLVASSYQNVLMLLGALALCGGILVAHWQELNAFAIGEDNARHIGVNVRRVKLVVLICVAVLIGVTVAVGGTIAFVGLVTPHMVRMVAGPNHRRLLPASVFSGAVFLMLCDLCARVLLRPLELPIGVVTSLIGAVAFIYIFATAGRAGR